MEHPCNTHPYIGYSTLVAPGGAYQRDYSVAYPADYSGAYPADYSGAYPADYSVYGSRGYTSGYPASSLVDYAYGSRYGARGYPAMPSAVVANPAAV